MGSIVQRDIDLAQRVWPEPWKASTTHSVAWCAARLREHSVPDDLALGVLSTMAAAIKAEYGD